MSDPAHLESFLNRHLLGQREAVGEFSSAIVRACVGPRRPGRPRGFILLLGPTGTGKTEMVNLAARFLYGMNAGVKLERFDMGEYQHPDSVKRLLGAPDQSPLMGRAIDRLNGRGGGILLLDEIEKAFPDLLTVLLSFDSARSTMSDGVTRDLSRLFIVLTSNLGAAEAARMENSGYSAVRRKLRHAAEEKFQKEGLARFTSIICLNILSYDVQREIARRILDAELALQRAHLRRHLESEPDVLGFLISHGFSPDLGARNIRNTIEQFVGGAVAPHTRTRPFACDSAAGMHPCAVGDRWSEALVIAVEGEALSARRLSRAGAFEAVLAGDEAASRTARTPAFEPLCAA